MKKKCYIYTRVSTEAQIDGYSLNAQKERLRQYASYKDLDIVGEYCDAGKSGHSIKGRPSFIRMMEDVMSEKDGISFVLVYKLSRFGRNAADVMKSLQLLMDYDVDLVCVEDAIDSSTQGGRLTLAILSSVAEIERENITAQFMAGRMQKLMEDGWAGGAPPYGYQIVDKRLVVKENEAEAVRQIYQKFLEPGTGYSTIAKWLNDQGYTRLIEGVVKPFHPETVRIILQNPIYCGKLYYNRRTNSERIRQNPKDVICIPGKHEAIIPENIWNLVKEKREASPGKNEKIDDPDRISLLSGLVKCPVCGKGLVKTKNKKLNKNHGGYYKTLYYYSCREHRKAEGRTCSFSHTYNQEKLDAAVLENISRVTSMEEFKRTLSMAIGDRSAMEMLEAEIKALRKRIHGEEHLKYKLGTDLDHLDIFSDTYDSEYEAIMEKINASYDRISKSQMELDQKMRRLQTIRRGIDSTEQVCRILDNFDKLFISMNYVERREMCRKFIQRIDVFPEARSDGRILKQIVFRIPIYYNQQGDADASDDSGDEVRFALDCTKLPPTAAELKPTYPLIKARVLKMTGLKVSSLNIAQVKRKYGIDVGMNYNKAEDPGKPAPKCTKVREIAILDALKYFRVLPEDTEYMEERT